MKLFLNILLLLVSINVCGQADEPTTTWNNYIFSGRDEKEFKDSLSQYDFASLWKERENTRVGFIGDNYQRIRIKFISVNKLKDSPLVYEVTGKSMVDNLICDFHGIITITSIKIDSSMHFGVDDEYKNQKIKKQGVVIAAYDLLEDSLQRHSGFFNGILFTAWYINRFGKLMYDDIEIYSDRYRNNQFIGTWTDYKSRKMEKCNWGDYRIPNSGDLDIGAGEFSPDDKYLKYGWQTYRDSHLHDNIKAKQFEEKEWWK